MTAGEATQHKSEWNAAFLTDYLVLLGAVAALGLIAALVFAWAESPVTAVVSITLFFLATDTHGVNEDDWIPMFASYVYHLMIVFWGVAWIVYNRRVVRHSGKGYARAVLLRLIPFTIAVHELVFWLFFDVSLLLPARPW